jgi:UDP-N-acetylmuramoyl-L-alanyl-D-glutamate--2,6-diaminopimelate ligase
MAIKSFIKKLIPKAIFPLYHLVLAWTGAVVYGFPSRKMMIIGVTGTRGKTTTSNYIWSVLTAAGYKVGQTGTANIRIGEREMMNPYHMTMPGRFKMQELLSQMAKAGCEIAIVETPSEGVEQFRHKGIAYDFMVFTVLYPEHLAIHNWDPERCTAKMIELFAELKKQPAKKLRGARIEKTFIVNRDSNAWERFWNNPADKKIGFGIKNCANVVAGGINPQPNGVKFIVDGKLYSLNIPGEYNVANALPAIAIGRELKLSDETIANGLSDLGTIPGRMEKIEAGQPFAVYVDYAHDGPSLEALLKSARQMKGANGHVIITVGAEGGGRDKDKRPVMGRLCAALADLTIVTNVDPYDDEPMPIISDIANAALAAGAKLNENIFIIEDRRAGINKALSLAKAGDIVLVTGKGAEQSMELDGHSIPWDDRAVVREELIKMSNVECRMSNSGIPLSTN